ncbi:MAG: lipopolysaccharide biosynthesis protein [Planifilum sp.]|jgi:O-antigen/teichoic acid export membrane protein
MLAKLKQLFSDSAAFAIAQMGNKLVAFLLIPVYTRYLDPGQYADWGLTNTITMIVSYLSILGTDAALAFYYFDAKEKQERRAFFTAATLFSAGICTLFLIAALGLGAPLAQILYGREMGYEYLLTLAMLATVAAIIIQMNLAYARYSRKVWTFNVMSMSYVIGSALLNVFFLKYTDWGVNGIFVGQVLGGAVVALILVWMFRKEFTRQVRWVHLKHLLRYGAPLLPTLLAFWVMNMLNRPMIIYFVSREEAGLFETAFRFASVIALVTAAFQLAWRPFAMSIKERSDAPAIYSLVGRAFIVVAALAIMFLSFVIQPLMELATGQPEFAQAYPYVWMLSLATVLNTFHLIVGVGLLIRKQTQVISKIFIMAAVLYVLGNLVAIPLFHNWGAGAMAMLAYLFIVIVIHRRSRSAYPINFRMGSILAFLVVYLAVMAGITWIQVNDWSNKWLYYSLGLAVVTVAVFVTGIFRFQTFFGTLQRLPGLLKGR